jgi:hypothetical protein
MWHLRLIGWLWFLIGGFWWVVSLVVLMAPSPVGPTGLVVTKSQTMWWQDVIQTPLEMSFFVGSAVSGFVLLRRWRCSRVAVCIFSAIWLTFCVYIISSAEGGLPILDLFWGPFTLVSIYSMVTLAFVTYAPRPA